MVNDRELTQEPNLIQPSENPPVKEPQIIEGHFDLGDAFIAIAYSEDEGVISAKISISELKTVFQRALNTYPDPSPQLLELADKIAAMPLTTAAT